MLKCKKKKKPTKPNKTFLRWIRLEKHYFYLNNVLFWLWGGKLVTIYLKQPTLIQFKLIQIWSILLEKYYYYISWGKKPYSQGFLYTTLQVIFKRVQSLFILGPSQPQDFLYNLKYKQTKTPPNIKRGRERHYYYLKKCIANN